MAVAWNLNEDRPIINECSGKTVIIRLKDEHKGISHTDEETGEEYTVDISWIRLDNKICATTGKYEMDDVLSWAEI